MELYFWVQFLQGFQKVEIADRVFTHLCSSSQVSWWSKPSSSHKEHARVFNLHSFVEEWSYSSQCFMRHNRAISHHKLMDVFIILWLDNKQELIISLHSASTTAQGRGCLKLGNLHTKNKNWLPYGILFLGFTQND
jgi:hypothetical protein